MWKKKEGEEGEEGPRNVSGKDPVAW